jgi:Asparagine synthase
MTERPVAQVVVFGDRSPSARAAIVHRLTRMGANVTEIEPHWVLGTLPIPGTPADPQALANRGVAFVEGRDRAETSFGDRVINETIRRLNSVSTIGQLPGDISLVHIDNDQATVVRSCAGLSHWYVHQRPGSVMVATRLRFFEELFDEEFAMDELVGAAWARDCGLPWNRTPLVGVTVVPAAHVARIEIGKALRSERYWDPADIEVTGSARDRPDQFLELFRETLERDLSSEVANMATFSGGVDSSIIVAMMVELGREVQTFSMRPSLECDDSLPSRRSVDTFFEKIPVSKNWYADFDEHTWVDLLLKAPAMRVPMLNPTLIMGQHYGALEGLRVMIGGEAADELFGGWNTLYDAWIPALSPLSLCRMMVGRREYFERYRALRRWAAKRIKRDGVQPPVYAALPKVMRPDLQAEFAQYVAELRVEVRAINSPRAYEIASVRHPGWLLQSWEGCSEAGMRRSLPFHNREAIEFTFACRPTELAWPPKKLLRKSFDGLVPSSHLHRLDKDAAGYSPLANVPMRIPEAIPESVKALFDPSKIDLSGPISPVEASYVAPMIRAAKRPAPYRSPD